MNPRRHPLPETATAPGPGPGAAWSQAVQARVLRVQGWLHALDRRRPWLLDTVVTVAVAITSVTNLDHGNRHGALTSHAGSELPVSARAALALTLAVPLWWRRRACVPAFFAIALICLAQWSLGIWLQAVLALLVGLFNLALHGPARLAGWAIALTCLESGLAVLWLSPVTAPLPALLLVTGNAIGAVALGFTVRTRRAYLAALEQRAAWLETDRHQRAQLAVAGERARVAREMHDILGHNLAVVVGLADGAAALAARRHEQTEQPLRLIGDTARGALGELRRVLNVLQEGPPQARLNPQPGIADLDALLERVRAAGLHVSYRTEGDVGALEDGAQLTVYRIVQESLTNVLKHAGPGATARVGVLAANGQVRVRVHDDGPALGSAPPAPSHTPPHPAGLGLVGIRQRAALYGGSATIGPGSHGGWSVDVLLDPGQPDRQGAHA